MSVTETVEFYKRENLAVMSSRECSRATTLNDEKCGERERNRKASSVNGRSGYDITTGLSFNDGAFEERQTTYIIHYTKRRERLSSQ